MRKIFGLALLAIVPLACKKTGEGEYQVEKPVIGTQTDTIHTPSVDVRMDSATVAVPNVEVKRDSATIKVPKVDIKGAKP